MRAGQRGAALVFFVVTLIGAAIVFGVQARGSNPHPRADRTPPAARCAPTSAAHRASTSTSTSSTTTSTAPSQPAVDRPLQLLKTVTGNISPKSVVATDNGFVFAQNMMYRHTMTVYDRTGSLVKTIPDGVDLASFGYPWHAG